VSSVATTWDVEKEGKAREGGKDKKEG